MNQQSFVDKFLELSQRELATLSGAIPSDPFGKAAVLLEVLRSLDYLTICEPLVPPSRKVGVLDLQVLHWGWNVAVEMLLAPISQRGAMPVMAPHEHSTQYGATLLHQAGRACLLKRTSDMIRYGLLTVEELTDRYIVRRSGDFLDRQFADQLEVSQLDDLESLLNDPMKDAAHGWTLVDRNSAENVATQAGAFMTRGRTDPLAEWKRDDVDSLMSPLIFPWNSGRGIMMGYDAHPDVDDHFTSEGLAFIDECRREAGLHPEAIFQGTTGSDVTAIAAIVAGLHMKHIRFALLSQKTHSEIDLSKSLTIWGPRTELIDSLADFSGLDHSRVDKALTAISLHASESRLLTNRTTPLIPMLIDLGNGHILRPASSISRNPLSCVLPLHVFRGGCSTQELMSPREDWMRSEIYWMFQGARYARVDGNIKLRDGGRVLTDVDAAILDRTSGDLALFQIKWQDWSTNDVRELRSKASNFVREIEKWATRVCEWIAGRSANEVLTAFRFNAGSDGYVRRIFLFVVSRHASRMSGYGFESNNAFLALSTWAQWIRVRAQVGPVPEVFDKIHEKLCEEHLTTAEVTPMPFAINVSSADTVVEYADLFCTQADSSSEDKAQ